MATLLLEQVSLFNEPSLYFVLVTHLMVWLHVVYTLKKAHIALKEKACQFIYRAITLIDAVSETVLL